MPGMSVTQITQSDTAISDVVFQSGEQLLVKFQIKESTIFP